MEKSLLEEMLARKLGLRSMAKERRCSCSTIRHWMKQHDLKPAHTTPGKSQVGSVFKCQACGKGYIYSHGRNSLRNCGACLSNKNRFKKRATLLHMFGAKCTKCGYNKCADALEFHHLDPASKKMALGSNHCRSLPKLIEEAKKCVLICSNCHAETHSTGRTDIELKKLQILDE